MGACRCGCKEIAAFICHIYCREMKNDGNKFQLRKKRIFQLLFNKTLISLVFINIQSSVGTFFYTLVQKVAGER